jgi:Fe-Mn family superoxide dismutase
MAFEISLPFPTGALAPHISQETLEFHFGKHHQTYLTRLNDAVAADAALQGQSLVKIVQTASGALFNNAAQTWNHSFYWNCLRPGGGGAPTGRIAAAINAAFGDFQRFREAFTARAVGHFGSGWAWLVRDGDGKLAIVDTHDAGCPITAGLVPVLTCDVWEHAYYVDYRNARPRYVEAWWNLVNWDFANANL